MRKGLIWLTEWNWFEFFILAVILVNSVCLAIYDYSDREDTSLFNRKLYYIGQAVNGIFIIECLFKIVAKGFVVHRRAYLRDSWNVMDFIIVVLALTEFFPSIKAFRALRILRALRPLRSINAVKSMRRLVNVLA